MRTSLILLMSFLFYESSGQNLSYDTSKIAIIPFVVKNFYGELDNSNVPSTLTQDDLSALEKIFLQSIVEHDSSLNGKKAFYIDLDHWNYRRQYICYLNKEGEKIVYANCFCATFNPDWHKFMVIVDDGGKCFFSVKINLTTGKYFDFFVNGYG
jgi:hypothetical protein